MRQLLQAVVITTATGLLLLGCAATSPPTPTPTPLHTSTPDTQASLSTPAPSLAVPAQLPGEVTRTVMTPKMNDATSADFPTGARRFYLHLACSGPTGTVMRYEVEHADGSSFGPSGTWTCDRRPGVIEAQSATRPTGGVQVRLQTDPGVISAWAIFSTSATTLDLAASST